MICKPALERKAGASALRLLAFLFVSMHAGTGMAQDWPSWRGGDKHGSSNVAAAPLEWSRTEGIKWMQEIPGRGSSSPVIADGQAFLTTASLRDQAKASRQVWSAARYFLVVLVAALCASILIQGSDRSNAADILGSSAIGVCLLTVAFLEIFGDGVFDYPRCSVRSWLGSSLSVSLCLVIATYRLQPRSVWMLILGLSMILFGTTVFFAVPSKDHALRGGIFAVNAGVVMTFAIIPAALGLMCCGNFAFAHKPEKTLSLRRRFHLLITTLVISWAAVFAWRLGFLRLSDRVGNYSDSNQLTILFLILCVPLIAGVGASLYAWGMSKNRSESWTPMPFGSIATLVAAILITLILTAAGIWQAIEWSPYLAYHFSNAELLLPSATELLAIAVFACILTFAVGSYSVRYPAQAMAVTRAIAVLLALVVFTDRNFVSKHTVLTRGIVSISVDSGEIQWVAHAIDGQEGPLHRDNSPATPTATFWNDHVYAVFSLGVVCCDASGTIKWTNRNVTFESAYGVGASPAVSDGVLVVANLMPKSGYVVGLDCETGEALWQHDFTNIRTNISGCSRTPIIMNVRGRKTAVIWGYDGLTGLDLVTGEQLWYWAIGGVEGDMVSSLIADGERLYCCSPSVVTALDPALLGIQDPTVWDSSVKGPNISSPVLCGEFLLFVSDNGILTCLNAATGDRQWRKRISGTYYASPIAMGQYVYFCNVDGETTVVRAASEFDLISTNQSDGKTRASFAIKGDGILFRTENHLFHVNNPAIEKPGLPAS